jgi:hypothetical protein
MLRLLPFLGLILLLGCETRAVSQLQIQSYPQEHQVKPLKIVVDAPVTFPKGNRTSVEPMTQELLPEPIKLECKGLTIIEWRSTPQFQKMTSPSPEAIAVINHLCSEAFSKYPEFLWSQFNWTATTTDHNFDVKISMIPSNNNLDGDAPRSLNDFKFRFSNIPQVCCNLGLYLENRSYLLLRNDPLILSHGKLVQYPNFAKIFVHELAHVMNDKFGYKNKYFPGDVNRDEALAQNFSVWMGFTFDIENYEQDVNNKITSR